MKMNCEKETNCDDIPVIKVFSVEGQYYLYDTFTNRLLSISREHYIEIHSLLKSGLSNYINSASNNFYKNDIVFLIKKGMLQSGFINRIEHPLTNYLPQLVDSCLSEMIFQVTQNCNFRCKYCTFALDNGFERIHTNRQMPWEIAKKALDYLFDHSHFSHEITLFFYGGEPLLNYDLIKKITDYSQELFCLKPIKYNTTINASVLTEEMVRFFIKYNFHIAISFDGNKRIQNSHRKFADSGMGTFDVVYKKIEMIRSIDENFFSNNITIMPVYFDDEKLEDVITYFSSIGINNVSPLNVDLRGIDYKPSQFNLVKDDSLTNIKKMRSTNDISIDFEEVLSETSEIPAVWHHNGPCVAGVNRLFVDVDGTYYPCEKACDSNAFRIGSVIDGIDISAVNRLLNVGLMSQVRCTSCWAMRFCNICCVQCHDTETDHLDDSVKKQFCEMVKTKVLSFLKSKVKRGKQQ